MGIRRRMIGCAGGVRRIRGFGVDGRLSRLVRHADCVA